jgi:hypothetical protein
VITLNDFNLSLVIKRTRLRVNKRLLTRGPCVVSKSLVFQPGCRGTQRCQKDVLGMQPNFELQHFIGVLEQRMPQIVNFLTK